MIRERSTSVAAAAALIVVALALPVRADLAAPAAPIAPTSNPTAFAVIARASLPVPYLGGFLGEAPRRSISTGISEDFPCPLELSI